MSSTSLVFRRQVSAALADPGPSFILPLMPSLLMLVVFTSLFDSLSQAAGFSTDAFSTSTWDAYVAPGVIVLVAMLGAGYTSASLASDLRSGYAYRMHLAGCDAASMVLGRLAFEAVRLVPGVFAATGVALLVGGKADNGLLGIVIMAGLISLLGVAFSGIFYVAAIATEDPQTPFTMQPLGLPLAFLSSALVPIVVMPNWSGTIARYNPVSVVVDACRNAMIGDLWSSELWTAIALLAAATIVVETVAITMLATKLSDGKASAPAQSATETSAPNGMAGALR